MNSEDREWLAEGPRWLEKIPCEKCSSVGFLVSKKHETCKVCKGIGFVESAAKDVVLCPNCHGTRNISVETKECCGGCEGRGFLPKIMQKFVKAIDCTNCNGSGEIDYETGELETCLDCSGEGSTDEGEYCPLPKWKSSPLRPKSLIQTVSSCDENRDEFQSDSGDYLIKVVACTECEENGKDPDCPHCLGVGRLIHIAKTCANCHGNGSIDVVETEECSDCDGNGKTYQSEDREV